MITLKVVIRPDRLKKDGTWPVNIRISYQRKTTYISTPYFVTKSQINKAFEIKDRFLQMQVEEDLNRARREISSSFYKLAELNSSQIGEYLSVYLYSNKRDSINFFEFAEKHIARMEENNQASRGNYGISVRKIKSFVGHEDFSFNDININFLSNFDTWLKNTGVGTRGRSLYLSNLRAIFNAAVREYNDEENDVVKITKNPFKRFSLPKVDTPEKRALTLDQMKAFIEYQPAKETVQLAKDVFLLSFFLVGMNSVDLYQVNKISGERITYRRAKTRGVRADGAEISIKIEPEAMELIKKYKDKEKERAFNFHYRYSTAAGFNSAVNEYLKVIGKAIKVDQLDFYAARHTWATLFVNECGGSESEAAFCLNHVSEHKVTSGYIKKDFARIDRANRKVIDLVYRKE
jgi:integrase